MRTGKKHITCPVCNEETDFTDREDAGLLDLHLNSLVGDSDTFDHDVGSDISDFSEIDEEREDWGDIVSIHRNWSA